MDALLEPYGIRVDANTALRAVPHERALHPAEPLVADGVLTTALAAALGRCADRKAGAGGADAWAASRPSTAAPRRPSTAGALLSKTWVSLMVKGAEAGPMGRVQTRCIEQMLPVCILAASTASAGCHSLKGRFAQGNTAAVHGAQASCTCA